MKEEFKIVRGPRAAGPDLSFLAPDHAAKVQRFHASFPMYEETPLADLRHTARALGLGSIFVKDESFRFGLNAFKVLGGSYAIGCYIAERLGIREDDLTYDRLVRPETAQQLGNITFVTATDGNHGRGVAWTAHLLGCRSVVYMPKGSAAARLENIRKEGAEASITDLNYDDAVRLANKMAREHGWVIIQDTAWPGYEDIPRHIMQGYGTMGLEAARQLGSRPTHIFLQAGVGSMAASITGLFAAMYGEDRPTVVIVEPNKADCLYQTALANDGICHAVKGPMDTIMAGLACGEPCTIGWEVLKSYADYFISCPDYTAAKGMRMLASPVPDDPRITSGESGAASFGALAQIMTDSSLAYIRKMLRLDETSCVLLFSTEGNTDPVRYASIVWDGAWPSVPGKDCNEAGGIL